MNGFARPSESGSHMARLFVQLETGERLPTLAEPRLLFPGSFNPLHQGHLELAAVATEELATPVQFELSIANVDKPDLPEEVLAERLQLFRGIAPIWVTRAPTFAEKAELFPGCCFVVGYDTAVRLLDLKYYQQSEQIREAALDLLLNLQCHFVVGGRIDASGTFRIWQTDAVEKRYRSLFQALPEQRFRHDISSTMLRQKQLTRPQSA